MSPEYDHSKWANIRPPKGVRLGEYGHAHKVLRMRDKVEQGAEARMGADFEKELIDALTISIITHVSVGHLPLQVLIDGEINVMEHRENLIQEIEFKKVGLNSFLSTIINSITSGKLPLAGLRSIIYQDDIYDYNPSYSMDGWRE